MTAHNLEDNLKPIYEKKKQLALGLSYSKLE